jgi:hypothetical protein
MHAKRSIFYPDTAAIKSGQRVLWSSHTNCKKYSQIIDPISCDH